MKLDNISFICSILNRNAVEHIIIIGGTAVILHGYFRYTTNLSNETTEKEDIDIFYNPTYKNYFLLLNALKDLGQDVSAFEAEQAPNPKKSFFKFSFLDFTLDLLPKLVNNEDFTQLFQRKELININGIETNFLGYEDLISIKKLASRPKDLLDIAELEKIKNINKSKYSYIFIQNVAIFAFINYNSLTNFSAKIFIISLTLRNSAKISSSVPVAFAGSGKE